MIQQITIGGKERPIRIGMAALAQFEQETGKSFLQGFKLDEFTLQDMASLIRLGLISGARQHNDATAVAEVPDVVGVLDWMDEDGAGVTDFISVITTQMQAITGKNAGGEPEKNAKGAKK